jgi:hypothetical protein
MQTSKNDRHFVLNPRNSRSGGDDKRQEEDGCDESSAAPLSSNSMGMKSKVSLTTHGIQIQNAKNLHWKKKKMVVSHRSPP